MATKITFTRSTRPALSSDSMSLSIPPLTIPDHASYVRHQTERHHDCIWTASTPYSNTICCIPSRPRDKPVTSAIIAARKSGQPGTQSLSATSRAKFTQLTYLPRNLECMS
ncbi:hypothetical protein VFPPC_15204 [Pochonia chlamydosporia 170]|uniref:Uncharacterized protein n=1 Tax=Pochonia chlamydosporia 170 TaxID=1380566 RepID=A0A179G6Q4_METCM|nr:hypothetical protein VFPPC_15204 [Pochonia chlamydosporia 170]OAQ72859.1 hypothetical protein VFPPC_15204 [Pochonia chlamydosporia 170]